MTQRALPKYFVAHSAEPNATPTLADPSLTWHVLDSFTLHARHRQPSPWLVVLDSLGNLQALPETERSAMPATAQQQLAYHEIADSHRQPLLEAQEIYLFALQLLEQPVGAPGCNDPVYLYGTLSGPYPDAAGAAPICLQGQLMVTRGDVLTGLTQSAAAAFRYARADVSEQMQRCFHLLLPGGADDETARGESLILAYPLFPRELITQNAANESIVSQLLYDLLSGIQEDLVRENLHHPLRTVQLPVPSRFALEQQLQAEGYVIKGDTAHKQAAGGEGFQGKLASLFGALLNEKVTLPPEGTIEQFLTLAQQTLTALPGWPSARARALQQLARETTTPAHPNRPANTTSQTPLPVARPQMPPRLPSATSTSSDWMQDFLAAHRPAQGPAPRLTSTANVHPTKTTSSPARSSSDWMKDFAENSLSERTNNEAKQRPVPRPEWMEDFE